MSEQLFRHPRNEEEAEYSVMHSVVKVAAALLIEDGEQAAAARMWAAKRRYTLVTDSWPDDEMKTLLRAACRKGRE